MPALRPDVTIVHAQKADRRGNVLVRGIVGVQKEAVLAASRAVVTVEEVVDDLETDRDQRRGAAVVDGWRDCGACRAARGRRTRTATTRRDNAFYVEWDAIARDRERFRAWIDEHVMSATGSTAGSAARR